MKDATVPTMRELRKAAKAVGAVVYRVTFARGGARYPGGTIWVRPKDGPSAPFDYHPQWPYSRARYLAGQHIEALKRMQEAGL